MGFLIFLIVMVPLFVISIVTFRGSLKTIEETTFNRLMVESQLKEYHLEHWIEDNKRSIREFARRPLIRLYSEKLVNPDKTGDESLNIQHNIRNNHFLPNIEEEKKFLEMFLMSAIDGLILVSSNPKNEGIFRENTKYFQEGLQNTYIQNVYHSMIMEGPSMTLSTPVYNGDNDIVAVLAARLSLDELTSIMQYGSKESLSTETYLINQFSFFVTESRFELNTLLKKSLKTLASQKLKKKKDGTGKYKDYRGIAVYGVYRWIEHLGLGIITEVDADEVLVSISVMRNYFIITISIVFFVVVLMTLLFTRTITQPIKKLMKGVNEIGKGNLDNQIDVRGNDEIGLLAEKFNLMIANLKNITSSRDELDKEIAKKERFEEELIKSREKAEAATQSKSQFLSNMSHEIRTPLNSIIGFSDILLNDENNPEKKSKLKILNSSGHHLLDLVNDILDFSKIEAEKLEIEKINFSIKDLLQSIEDIFYVSLKEKNLEFKITLHGEVPEYLYGDEHRIYQILLNLIGNSIKFTESGNISLYCSYENHFVIIKVQDTGIGIPEEKKDAIFNKFVQSNKSVTRQYGGTGLGLSISKNLVELMGGSITLESIQGRGSSFIISLPLSEPDPEWLINKELQIYIEALVKKWIIFFDDNPSIQKIAIKALNKLPMRINSLFNAIKDCDIKEIQLHAHDIKSDSGNFGFTEIYELIKNLEMVSRSDNPNLITIKELYGSIESIVSNIPAEYKEIEAGYSFPYLEIRKNLNILVADDNTLNRDLIEYYINTIGIGCDLAENGKQVLEILNQKDYDLLLLDIQMPVMGGLEVIERIRAMEKYNSLHVIALTANAMNGDSEFYIKSGCNDYLSKPLDKNLLLEKINNRIIGKEINL